MYPPTHLVLTPQTQQVVLPKSHPPAQSVSAYLIAQRHEVVCDYQALEDHHPAGVLQPLRQQVDESAELAAGLVGQL